MAARATHLRIVEQRPPVTHHDVIGINRMRGKGFLVQDLVDDTLEIMRR